MAGQLSSQRKIKADRVRRVVRDGLVGIDNKEGEIMKPSLWAAVFLFLTSGAFAQPAKFLAPDSTGRPQIQIIASGQYYLFRAADAYDGACDSRWYTTVTDQNNKTWCRTLAVYTQNSTFVDILPLDAVAENSPAEFEYMVGTSVNVNNAIYIGWTPQIAVGDSDPVITWLRKINTQYGIAIDRSNITITNDGSLILDWSNLFGNGFHITTTWNLKSNSDTISSSGLNGRVEVVTSSLQRKRIRLFHRINPQSSLKIPI
jgi:hypothetical protein